MKSYRTAVTVMIGNNMARKLDVALFYLLNLSSAFCLSAAHSVLLPKKVVPFGELKVPVITQFIIVYLSNLVHSQQRSGGLYLLRVFDFLTTTAVIAGKNTLYPTNDRLSYSLLVRFFKTLVKFTRSLRNHFFLRYICS
ncbi:unnamed protein product [Enterobius vermicularis]|uniref:Secreted protein n=1 Tax=Enterobius vermicularis TaxID=51028 RepID=A0A0N4VLF8_ENTVE|nr:unnamed protein product [Enterobius vermicularis]